MSATYNKQQAIEEIEKRVGFKVNPAEFNTMATRRGFKQFTDKEIEAIASELKPLQPKLEAAPTPLPAQPAKTVEQPKPTTTGATLSQDEALIKLQEELAIQVNQAELKLRLRQRGLTAPTDETLKQLESQLGFKVDAENVAELVQKYGFKPLEITPQQLAIIQTELYLHQLRLQCRQIESGLANAAEDLAVRQSAEKGKTRAVNSFIADITSEAKTKEQLYTLWLTEGAKELKNLLTHNRTNDLLRAAGIPLPQVTLQLAQASHLGYLQEAEEAAKNSQIAIASLMS